MTAPAPTLQPGRMWQPGRMTPAGRDVRVGCDIGVRGIEDLHALFDQSEVDALHHRDLRHEGRSAVVDGVGSCW